MDLLEDLATYYDVEISLHEIKNQVNVLIILCFDCVGESDDVGVIIHLLQKHDL